MRSSPRIGKAKIPYAALPLSLRLGIERALRWAWSQLLADKSGTAPNPLTATEDAISEDLQRRLNKIEATGQRLMARFTASLLESVQRGGSYKNYCGSSLNRAPDLTFRPIALPSGVANATDYGLFAECKIIDMSHPVALYLSNGLARYSGGEYAWAMSCSLMIGYVRDGSTVPSSLAQRLNVGDQFETKQVPALRVPDSGETPSVHVSVHGRSLTHPPTGQLLGDIEVAHLWLDAKLPRAISSRKR